jgi:hypothetical protein
MHGIYNPCNISNKEKIMTKKIGWKLAFIAVVVGLVFSSAGCALLGGALKPTASEELSNHEVQEEYTLVYRGDVQGTVTVRRDRSGKITVTPNMTKLDSVEIIDNALCPLIPAVPKWAPVLAISKDNPSIVIEGNTTIETYPDGSGSKTVIQGNTVTETRLNSGWWRKTIVEGNITTQTISNGQWNKTVVDGNTTMQTYSSGAWYKDVVNGNTKIHTNSYDDQFRTVVDGNTTTETNVVNGKWEKWVVEGDTKTTTYSDGRWTKRVVERQGTTIYITQERG